MSILANSFPLCLLLTIAGIRMSFSSCLQEEMLEVGGMHAVHLCLA